jgi:large subunit ribosomal protein L6
MSRLSKKPINIPEKVDVVVNGGKITVKGPLGELSKDFGVGFANVSVNGREIVIEKNQSGGKNAGVFIGTCAAHVKNMINGTLKGYEKKLIVEGVGYKAAVQGNDLVLNLGLSHPVNKAIPAGLKVQVEKGVIAVAGADKELLGQFCASVRALKKPEPYKGKGIRYDNEGIIRQAGKKAVASA